MKLLTDILTIHFKGVIYHKVISHLIFGILIILRLLFWCLSVFVCNIAHNVLRICEAGEF
jgi:hypothetical protein